MRYQDLCMLSRRKYHCINKLCTVVMDHLGWTFVSVEEF